MSGETGDGLPRQFVAGIECVGVPSKDAQQYRDLTTQHARLGDRSMCRPCPNNTPSGCLMGMKNASCWEINGAPFNLVWFKPEHFVKFVTLKFEGNL